MSARLLTQSQLEYLLAAEAGYSDAPDTPYNSPFLRLLVSADRGRLTDSFVVSHYGPGEIVFQEGERGDIMYIIWSGRVALVKGNLDSPTILAYRGAGEIIGEMAIIENQPRSATIVALENLRILGINRGRFERLLQETPSVSLSIMEMLSSRLRRSDEARSTGELSEKRLSRQISALQSEKERLEELQRMRQETTELIIHDLRDPLSSIGVALTMLNLMLPEETLEANRQILEVVQASTERMQRLVETLLEVYRLQAGETRLVMNPLDLGAMVAEVVRRVSILNRKGIHLGTRLPPELPPVNADRDKIERVLTNLMDNALNYTPEDGRVTWEALREGDFVRVSLVDSGPGVPEGDREHIFERFAQAGDQRPGRRSFGLGLAYCRLAVEAHGGRIWVEPGEGGVGSRFAFTLPIHSKGEITSS